MRKSYSSEKEAEMRLVWQGPADSEFVSRMGVCYQGCEGACDRYQRAIRAGVCDTC